jgi:hypothetical protein
MATNNGTNNTIAEVLNDATPQLGGDLDTNAHDISFDTGKGIRDENGNEQLIFTTTAIATNYVSVANAASLANPTVTASGSDSNIGLDFQVKGTGAYNFLGTTTKAGSARLYEITTNGSNYIEHRAATSLSANYSVTWAANMGVTFQNFSADGYVVLQSSIVNIAYVNTPSYGSSYDQDCVLLYKPGAGSGAFSTALPLTLVQSPYIGTNDAHTNVLTNRYFYNIGTYGTGSSTGLAASNDVAYCFPIWLPAGQYDTIVIGISTADVSATADIDVWILNGNCDNSTISTDNPIAARKVDCGTISNVSTTGEKTLSFTSTYMAGWLWVVLRTDNIGTALSLGHSTNLSASNELFGIAGGSVSDSATLASESPVYGVYYNAITSYVNLSSTAFSGLLTDPVGIAIRCT